MNCELAHERIALASYGELADDQAHELNRHLTICPACRSEQQQANTFKRLLDEFPATEPDANLIARSRLRIEEALDALPPRRWYHRLNRFAANSLAGLRSAPLAASVLLLLGVGAGALVGYQLAESRTAQLAQIALQTGRFDPFGGQSLSTQSVSAQSLNLTDDLQAAEVENVSSIQRSPTGNFVEVHYDQVIPRKIFGSLSDPAIRQLLMLASENSASAGVRDDSVGLLADQCRIGKGCQDIRDALLIALRTDRNPNVRLKALSGLAPYVGDDKDLRDTVLDVLLHDLDPRIRSQAIAILAPVQADTSVRQVLSTVANSDQSLLIRVASRNVLRQTPEIQ